MSGIHAQILSTKTPTWQEQMPVCGLRLEHETYYMLSLEPDWVTLYLAAAQLYPLPTITDTEGWYQTDHTTLASLALNSNCAIHHCQGC